MRLVACLVAVLPLLVGRAAPASAGPSVLGFWPTRGTPGSEVLVTGAGFDPRVYATTVRFGGVAAAALQVSVDGSGASLHAVVPSGAVTGAITVTTAGGTASSAGLDVPTFAVSGVPELFTFHPRSGTRGQRVSLIGQGLRGVERVEFGGGAVALPPFQVRVDRAGAVLDAVVPAGATSGPIRVVTADGAVSTAVLEPVPSDGSGAFLIGQPPVLDGFVPPSGPPGTVIIIGGRNLFGTTDVHLGGTALVVTRIDERGTAVEALVPLGAVSGLLRATTAAGSADTSALDAPTFVVSAVPRIGDVFPPSGDPGTLVTILGANFGRGPIPFFPESIPSENVVRHGAGTWVVEEVNDQRTRIRARVAAASRGAAPVVVESPGGQAVSSDPFTVGGAPVLRGFQPTSGVPGATITVSGRNLTHAGRVTFGGVVATAIAPGDDGTIVLATVPGDAVTGPITVTTGAGTAASGAAFIVLPTSPCGDGVVDGGEACDDGNLAPGDCCNTTCRHEVAGAACTSDGNVCTDDACDGAGRCTHAPNAGACDDGLYCNGADTCAAGACGLHAGDPCAGGADCRDVCDETGRTCRAPAGAPCAPDADLCSADVCDGAGACTHVLGPSPACTEPVRAGASRLKLLRPGSPDEDRLVWTLAEGGATSVDALGDPRTTTAYGLCLFDGSGALLLRAALPPGGTCAGEPCWRLQRKRIVYADPTRAAAGMRTLLVKAGRAGKTKVSAVGKGAALGLSSLALIDLPVTLQLHQSEGACWGARFSTPKRNDAERFYGKSDAPTRPAGVARGGPPS